MILSSHQQFVPHYISGRKQHSFRQGNRWRKGMSIQFYTGAYNKTRTKFMDDGVCTDALEVEIVNHPCSIIMRIDGCILHKRDLIHIAHMDGFDSYKEFQEYFFPKNSHGVWKGQLVHWTDFRYSYQYFEELHANTEAS